MNPQILSEVALEERIKKEFGAQVDVGKMIVHNAPVGRAITASVFLTSKKQLYCYVHGQSKLVLSDVKKIMTRMGLRAEMYMPPKGQPTYFDEIGRAKFREMFPGRGHVSDQDIAFYKTLALYNPALVQISEVKDGHVYQYDADSRTGWRVAVKFAYRRIKTS